MGWRFNWSKMNLRKLFVLFSLTVVTLLYQNCTPFGQAPYASKSLIISEAASSDGGDRGYEGKITYGSRPQAGVCADGSRIEESIEIDQIAKSAAVTRRACQDIEPTPISFETLDLLPHNLESLPMQTRLFERVQSGTLGGDRPIVFCRGRGKSTVDRIFNMVIDAQVDITPENNYFARVVVGKYDAEGKLVSTRDTGRVPVRLTVYDFAPNSLFFFHFENGQRDWHLKISETTGGYSVHGGGEGTWEFPCLRML